MYAKPELTLVGNAAGLVLGNPGAPEEAHEPFEKVDPGIATNLEE